MLLFTLILPIVLCFCLALWAKGKRMENATWKQPTDVSLIALIIRWKGDLFQYFQDLKSNYGPLLRVRVIGCSIIIINDMKFAKVCLANANCAGNVSVPIFKKCVTLRGKLTNSSGEGITFAATHAATAQRKFFIKQFAERGRRNGDWQTQHEFQILSLIRELESKDGKPFLVSKFFAPFASRAVWTTLGNETLGANVIQAHLDALKSLTEFTTLSDLICIWMPELTVRLSWRWQEKFKVATTAAHLAKQEVDIILSKRIPNEPNNIIDAYQDKVEATIDTTSAFHPRKNNIYSVMQDLLYGAIDTTSSTMDWLLLYMALNPRIQKNLQNEVDCKVGRNRLPNIHDRSEMPYTEACILEILRLQPLVPLSVPREVTCDTEVDGYFFQKGTTILTNTAAINRDPELWNEPSTYHPERFLCLETGQVLAEKRKLINTFSTGLRSCPGQQIAQETLFVFTAAIFQKFNVFSPGELSLTPSFGLLSPPKEQLFLSFHPRDE